MRKAYWRTRDFTAGRSEIRNQACLGQGKLRQPESRPDRLVPLEKPLHTASYTLLGSSSLCAQPLSSTSPIFTFSRNSRIILQLHQFAFPTFFSSVENRCLSTSSIEECLRVKALPLEGHISCTQGAYTRTIFLAPVMVNRPTSSSWLSI
jgi:hypothetical protein